MTSCDVGQQAAVPWLSLGPLAGLFGLWLLGLLIFAIISRFGGRPRSERVAQMGGTRLLNAWTMEYGYWVIRGMGRVLVRLGVSPNTLTILSLVFSAAAAVALYQGRFGLGGWLMISAAIFDAFDGIVARATGMASEAGEYFDSVVDRYGELLTFTAVMGYYFPFQPLIAAVVGLAMIASMMITYNRTKGEAQGVTDLPSGLMRRHERLLYIGVGTAFSPIPAFWLEPEAARPVYHVAVAAFALVALLGNLAAIRLAWQVHHALQSAPERAARLDKDSPRGDLGEDSSRGER